MGEADHSPHNYVTRGCSHLRLAVVLAKSVKSANNFPNSELCVGGGSLACKSTSVLPIHNGVHKPIIYSQVSKMDVVPNNISDCNLYLLTMIMSVKKVYLFPKLILAQTVLFSL